MTNIEKQLKETFKELYPKKRILAVQLNGFSHKVFYDSGTYASPVIIEEYSAYTKVERQTEAVAKLLSMYPHYSYQGNPLEVVYVRPEDR